MIAPAFAQLEAKYPNCQFRKVDVDQQRQIATECGIRAMPTFQIFKQGARQHEVVGANLAQLEQYIVQLGGAFQSFSGTGKTLGSGGRGEAGTAYVNPWADSARFEKDKSTTTTTKDEEDSMDVDDEDVDAELLKSVLEKNKPKGKNFLKELKEKQKEAGEGKDSAPSNMSEEEKMALLEKTVTASLLEQLIGMGFPKVRAIKALIETGNAGIAEAIDWIEKHQNDEDIDTLPEFTVETEEEKRARLEEQKRIVKMQLEENRRIRTEEAKKEQKEREKKRRMMGKNTQESMRKWEIEQRERERELQKKAKREEAEARKRLKKQLKIDQLQRKLDRLDNTPNNAAEIDRLQNEIAKLEGREHTSRSSTVTSTTTASTPSTETAQPKKSLGQDDCAVRIRMLDGSTITAAFKPTDTINTVLQHAQQLQRGRYTLMTPFPRKTFTGSDLHTTLKDAGLTPRGSVICTDAF